MSIFSVTNFNWLPRPSMYAEAQAWTQRQSILRQQLDDLASVSDLFGSVAVAQSQGMASLAAQAALTRTQVAAQTKTQSVLGSALDSPSPTPAATSLTLRDGTVIKDDPNTYLSNGSKLNLSAGTLTLSDGTVIDTATGLKKVNVTV